MQGSTATLHFEEAAFIPESREPGPTSDADAQPAAAGGR